MSKRLDTERQEKLEPKRLRYAVGKLQELGYACTIFAGKRVEFQYNGNTIQFYPYSGWHTGKGIKDGRGIMNLLKQIEEGL